MTNTPNLHLPDGYLDTGKTRNCGIVGLSALIEKPYREVEQAIWRDIHDRLKKLSAAYRTTTSYRRWGGSCFSKAQFTLVAHQLGVSIKRTQIRRQHLQTFVRRSTKPGVTYCIRVTRHIVTVRDGWVMDQAGVCRIEDHFARHKIATDVWVRA